MSKLKVFVGSSREQLAIAVELKNCLSPYAEIKVWDDANFQLNQSIFGNLLRAAEECDFAIFVFEADDVARIRKAEMQIVRDNVLFEFGLFSGRMGRGRSFWITSTGARAPHIPTDLAGIFPLEYSRPKKNTSVELRKALQKSCDRLRAEFEKLGPRTDRTIQEITATRILCAASAEYSQSRFAKDIEAIQRNFPAGSITSAHGVSAQQFWEYFSAGPKWDLVHLAMYVDAHNGDILIGTESGTKHRTAKRIPADGIEKVIRDTLPHLVVIVTCDSLDLAARIARITNAIAGYRPINPEVALDWSAVFYHYLALGCPLSEAFNRAQSLADPGLLLLIKHDFRLNLASQDSQRSIV